MRALRGHAVVWLLGGACIAGVTWTYGTSPGRHARAIAHQLRQHSSEAHACSEEERDEMRPPLERLASEKPAVVIELFRLLGRKAKPDAVWQLCPAQMDQLVGIALGLDHDGSRSRELLENVVLPALESRQAAPSPLMGWTLGSARLHVDLDMAKRLFESQLRRIEDGRHQDLFHERYRPDEYPPLARWASVLAANGDASQVQNFVPRLIALPRKHQGLAAGTLDILANLLTPDQALTTLTAALDVGAGFGPYEWRLPSLVARLPPAQTQVFIPRILLEIERHSLAHAQDREAPQRFRSWGEVLTTLTAKLDPAGRLQVAQAARRVLARAGDSDRENALVLAILPVMGPLDRSQVAPLLRSWLDELPSHVTTTMTRLQSFMTVAEHATEWLGKADPADVSRVAHRIRDLLLAEAAHDWVSAHVAEGLGAWAPLLSPSDAFNLADSLLREMVKARSDSVVDALSVPIQKLGQRVASKQALSLALILADRPSFAGSRTGAPAACLRALIQRVTADDRRTLQHRVGPQSAAHEDVALDAVPQRDAARAVYDQQRQSALDKLTRGVALPKDDPSAYTEALLGLWMQEPRPSRRSLLVGEMVRATSAAPSLRLTTYRQPIPPAQLYLDLLKDYRVEPDDWKVLVRAVRTASQRPPEGTLWELAWTRQAPATGARGLDWAGRPPW